MTPPDPETCARLARDVAPRWKWLAGMAFTTRMERGRIDFVNSEGGVYFTVAGKLVRAHDSSGTGRIPDLSDYMADVLDDDNDPVEVGAVVEHVTRSAAYLRSIGRHERADEADRYLVEVKALPGWANFQREVM